MQLERHAARGGIQQASFHVYRRHGDIHHVLPHHRAHALHAALHHHAALLRRLVIRRAAALGKGRHGRKRRGRCDCCNPVFHSESLPGWFHKVPESLSRKSHPDLIALKNA